MWIVTPVNPGGETYYLRPGKEYVVGRKNCDILLPSDQSISRAHAQLSATDETLTLKDTSKYGTFVNGAPITAPVNLKSGDAVTFGVFESKFRVDRQKPVVCSSCLDNDGKAALSQALSAVGGKVVSSWTQDCTHLVMPSVKVTVKTISALLCCCPIVKPEFFSELHRAVQQKQPPPKPESFTPEMDEPSLNREDVKLEVIPGRKQLFKGKTFIFLSAKQLKRLSTAVSFGGGTSQQLEEGSLPRVLLESPQSCVVDLSTASSHTPLSPSTAEWANSVKSIVERKGLRVITESEIGLAAVYASCDKYCNPSSPVGESESAAKLNPTIPGASLSQSAAVDETVLPAASQNVTTYVANTEASQGTRVCDANEAATVAETPEKKQSQNAKQPPRPRFAAEKTDTPSVVAESTRSSVNSQQSADARRQKRDSELPGGESRDVRLQSSSLKTNGGTNPPFYKRSPQKQKSSSQVSPQKQSTLTTFFKPANKKRPLDEEFSASEPKRSALQASVSSPASNSSSSFRPDTAADLFTRQSDTTSREPQGKKRKEVEEEICMEELESLMSEDMDCFDEPLDRKNTRQPQQEVSTSSTKQKQGSHSEEFESSSKRRRVHQEENGLTKQSGFEKESSFQKNDSKQLPVSVKAEPPHVTDSMTTTRSESSQPPQRTSAKTDSNTTPFGDDQAADVEDLELLQAENPQPKEETKTPLKPVQLKQEVQESHFDEDLPNKLVLVEFRSLTVTAPPRHKPAQTQSSSSSKNFKCFRKGRASQAFSHVIGGSDLLAHSRDKNADLDEWLRDVVEEENQKKRDESVGDDLFRYNPTKLTKRR
ncbi:nibrin [Salarias fasciatus]|uniref:Nibrin n=1 Tax=Salarias fasciatus TaxID=181472 RepID=A0A672J186_SALFA|nr:nibrin [Salarias fasciatus]